MSTAVHDGYHAGLSASTSLPSLTNLHRAAPPPPPPITTQRLVPSPLQITWELEARQRILRLLRDTEAARSPKNGDPQQQPRRPLMIAVAGIPGSGKSTSAEILGSLLPHCLCMPFDGYHYSLAELKNHASADDLIWRRGAPDTFDAAKLEADLHRIRWGDEEAIHLPGFDHAKGDPEPSRHCFRRRQHEIVITEGLYLLHDQDGWEHVRDCFDLTIFVDVDADLCLKRLKRRNRAIPGYTADEIALRVDTVDRVNAETVARSSRRRADWVVQSAAASF